MLLSQYDPIKVVVKLLVFLNMFLTNIWVSQWFLNVLKGLERSG